MPLVASYRHTCPQFSTRTPAVRVHATSSHTRVADNIAAQLQIIRSHYSNGNARFKYVDEPEKPNKPCDWHNTQTMGRA